MSIPPLDRLPNPGKRYDPRWADTLIQRLEEYTDRLWNGDHYIKALLQSAGARALKVTLVTAATYIILLTDDVIDVNRAGAVTLTLPASPKKFQRFYVQDSSGAAASNAITINKAAAININGGSSMVLATNYGRVLIIYNGTQYIGA
jgi:hypothetical protein